MKTIYTLIMTIVLLSSCKGQSANSLSVKERDAMIVAHVKQKADSIAKKANRKPATDFSLKKIDSLTTAEYFEYANSNLKKLIAIDDQFIQSQKMSMTTDSALMVVERDSPSKYEKARSSYEVAKKEIIELTISVEEKQRKLDSCAIIVEMNKNSFFGYHAIVDFMYEDSGKVKKGTAAILVSKDLQIIFL